MYSVPTLSKWFAPDLSKKIPADLLDPALLEGVYIPNLVASPFTVSKGYAELIYNRTSSPRLSKVLRKWDEEGWDAPEQRQKLAWVLLVELLSYQFASPVRWIETQDLFFKQYKFERFIEIGPSPTLTGMAARTLKAKYEAKDDSTGHVRRIFCASKDQKEIYYQFEDEPDVPAESATPTPPPVAPAPAAVASPTPTPTTTVSSAASIEDVPIRAVDILAAIVSQKLKKQLSEIPLSKSIKDLSNGKSTLQNEIMGDLQGEFSSAPDKGEELPLEELGAALGSGHSGNLGKYSTGLMSRAIGGKMPGGFNISTAKAHLSKTWGLGPQRADAVLLVATTMEPAKRLGSEAEGKAWLDAAAQVYAQRVGISLSAGGGSGSGGGSSGGAVMNSEEFLKFQAEQYEFAHQQINLYSRYLKRDPRQGEILFDKEKATSTQLQARLDSIGQEHGDTYINGIQPVFDALKARHFDSSWNWVRQDALLMFYDILFGRLTTVDREITARCIAIMNRADPDLTKFMEFMVNRCDPAKGETYATAKKLGQELLDNCRGVVGQPPLYKDGELSLSKICAQSHASQSLSLPRLIPKSMRGVRSSIPKSTGRTYASSRRMLKRWRAPTTSPVRSIFRRSRMMSSSSGMSSNPSPRSVRNRRIVSRPSMMAWCVRYAKLPTTVLAPAFLEAAVHRLSFYGLKFQALPPCQPTRFLSFISIDAWGPSGNTVLI